MPSDPLPEINLRLRVATVRDNTYVVAARGEADLFSAPTLWNTIEKLFDDGVRTIVVDFADVTFVDSTALGVLVSATQLLQGDGGKLYLTGGRGVLRRAAETAGLYSFLHFRDSLAAVPALAT
jgi:anti-anti-sigma factor